jgi:hypothetical protein
MVLWTYRKMEDDMEEYKDQQLVVLMAAKEV